MNFDQIVQIISNDDVFCGLLIPFIIINKKIIKFPFLADVMGKWFLFVGVGTTSYQVLIEVVLGSKWLITISTLNFLNPPQVEIFHVFLTALFPSKSLLAWLTEVLSLPLFFNLLCTFSCPLIPYLDMNPFPHTSY